MRQIITPITIKTLSNAIFDRQLYRWATKQKSTKQVVTSFKTY